MRRLVLALMCVALACSGRAQNANSGSELAAMLNFEADSPGTSPRGWSGGPPETIFLDEEVVHGGRRSLRLERNATSANGMTIR